MITHVFCWVDIIYSWKVIQYVKSFPLVNSLSTCDSILSPVPIQSSKIIWLSLFHPSKQLPFQNIDCIIPSHPQKPTKTSHWLKKAKWLLKMAFKCCMLSLWIAVPPAHAILLHTLLHFSARHVPSSLTLLLIFNHSQVYFVSFSTGSLKSLAKKPV